ENDVPDKSQDKEIRCHFGDKTKALGGLAQAFVVPPKFRPVKHCVVAGGQEDRSRGMFSRVAR
ncbi:MAG: hypothetical protein WA603_20895, partial [Candidatus Acidiferrales bacterium]